MLNTDLLNQAEIDAGVAVALDEDIGSGDLTAALLGNDRVSAKLLCREPAVLCGRPWFDRCFHHLDNTISINWFLEEGAQVETDAVICEIVGLAPVILTAERTALNFLQTLSAVSTMTKKYVDAVQGTTCKILDTRKTLPGLRKAEKYAVTCGGGFNHRIGLYDAVLIKENHIHAAGSICRALELARKSVDADVLVEIEVENLEQLQQAIDCGAKRVLLDNFPLQTLAKAVKMAGDSVETEASGNISLQNIKTVADSGVNYVSIGALTKNIQAIDLSLLFSY